MRSRMAIFGHPMHPIMIHLPLGGLLAVFATDLAFVFTQDPFWARAGLWLAGVGALGGWGAGLVGFGDLVLVPGIRKQILGWCHAIIAVMLLSLASLNWLMRFDDPIAWLWPWGLYVSALTAGLVVLAGMLGGTMVYSLGAGVHADS